MENTVLLGSNACIKKLFDEGVHLISADVEYIVGVVVSVVV